jgi:L-alanine-DL-glutamate epimerase-like enolase superfamily enzyme
MIAQRVMDIVQLDVGYIGGFTRSLQVARRAADAGLTCLPHSANLSMIFVFTLHLAASIRNAGQWVERNFRIKDADFYEPLLEVRNGRVQIPDEPGWGSTSTRLGFP